MLDLNNALMATFRFAAGQKSISADDLVVFAEIVYLVSGVTSPWKIQLILLSAHMLVFLGIDASSDRPQEHSPVVSPTMPYPQRKRKNVSTSRKLFSIRFTYIIASLKVSNSLQLLSFWLLGTHWISLVHWVMRILKCIDNLQSFFNVPLGPKNLN